MSSPKKRAVLPTRVFRRPEVEEFSGYSKSQLDEKIKRGEFPRPIKLSESDIAQAWLESELLEWLEGRIAARDADTDRDPRGS